MTKRIFNKFIIIALTICFFSINTYAAPSDIVSYEVYYETVKEAFAQKGLSFEQEYHEGDIFTQSDIDYMLDVAESYYSYITISDVEHNQLNNSRVIETSFSGIKDLQINSSYGAAKFQVSVTGNYDLQGNQIMRINSHGVRFSSGRNYNSHTLSTSSSYSRNIATINVSGDVLFTLTAPVTNFTYTIAEPINTNVTFDASTLYS